MMANLVELLERRRRLHPSRTALVFRGEEIDFRRLHERSLAVATQFARLGLRSQPVFVLIPTRPELPIVYYAAFMSGAIVVPINYSFKAPEITRILVHCPPRALIVHHSFASELKKIDPALLGAIPLKFFMGGNRASATPVGFTPFAVLEAGCEASLGGRDDAPSIIFHTSGTTGTPKGVVHTLRSVSCFARGYARLCAGDRSPVTIISRNCYHSGGFYHLMGALSCGTTCVLADNGISFDPDDYLRKTLEFESSQMFLSVSMLNGILMAKGLGPEHFAHATFVSAGADHVQPRHHDELSRYTDKPLITRYSSTEATCVTINDSGDLETRRNTIGRPLPHVEFEIDRPDTSGVGELLLKGEGLFLEYYKHPEANRGSFSEAGWFRTGDLVGRDRAGNLVFVGRSRRIIKVGGKVVYPTEIEEVADSYHAFEQTVAVPVPHAIDVQVPFLFVVPKRPGSKIDWPDFITFMRERIADYKLPLHHASLESIPLTSGGKVDRDRLAIAGAMLAEWESRDNV